MQWIFNVSVCLYLVVSLAYVNACRDCSYLLGEMEYDDLEYVPGCVCRCIPHRVRVKTLHRWDGFYFFPARFSRY